MSPFLPALGLPLLVAGVIAGAEPAPAKPKSQVLIDLAAGADWTFKPQPGRTDPFYDREKILAIEQAKKQAAESQSLAGIGQSEGLREYIRIQLSQVEHMITERRYDEAVHTADLAILKLSPESKQPGVDEALVRLRGYREQADEALIRNEAQAAFDNLGLRVQGIFWSDGQTRRCIVAGENQSKQVNDRVKDCMIMNIETDRVDFRYIYKKRRFEFPRYVGEDAKSASK